MHKNLLKVQIDMWILRRDYAIGIIIYRMTSITDKINRFIRIIGVRHKWYLGQIWLLKSARGKYKYVNVNTRQTNQKKKS